MWPIIIKDLAGFNPRTRTGCDGKPYYFLLSLRVSIHAPARGATETYKYINKRKVFQSTHPHGVRLDFPAVSRWPLGVSIHAPARGATILYGHKNLDETVSIHAPARGATKSIIKQDECITVSIHAPARGATLFITLIGRLIMFQSTHPHGVRLHDSRLYLTNRIVSIHAPARGATSLGDSVKVKYDSFNPRTRTGCDL